MKIANWISADCVQSVTENKTKDQNDTNEDDHCFANKKISAVTSI